MDGWMRTCNEEERETDEWKTGWTDRQIMNG